MKKFNFILILFLLLCPCLHAQHDLGELRWRQVVYDQPDEWYGSDEAIQIADNVLLYQRNSGGWPQFYPLKDDYSRQITYNDGSMVNIMNIMEAAINNTVRIIDS